MENEIKEYIVISECVQPDFWGNYSGPEKSFQDKINEKIKMGYVIYGPLSTTDGSSGSFFSSSQYPIYTQAMVRYGDIIELPKPSPPEPLPPLTLKQRLANYAIQLACGAFMGLLWILMHYLIKS